MRNEKIEGFYASRLTQQDSMTLERIQKTCLKVVLGDLYDDYQSALKFCGHQTLFERREKLKLCSPTLPETIEQTDCEVKWADFL